jgi:hypothetical protein
VSQLSSGRMGPTSTSCVSLAKVRPSYSIFDLLCYALPMYHFHAWAMYVTVTAPHNEAPGMYTSRPSNDSLLYYSNFHGD